MEADKKVKADESEKGYEKDDDKKAQTLKVFSKFFSNFKITKLKDNHEEAHKLFGENSRKKFKAVFENSI
ncbi:hypothetical protein [Helicobacter pylori]|uniref:hypothetical protein n=1 Tax=Helicobacter pylori TaxID=210 RepID=UPI000EB4ABE6|nr:hypothetical protein [Helicobacter pylori]RKV46722.1 hypothetical protein DD771_08170 [Helicobacter pylori]